MSNNKVLVSMAVTALIGNCLAEHSRRSDVVLVEGGTGETQVDADTGTGSMKAADVSGEIFQATEEWQEVLAGQVLPSGLHYRFALLVFPLSDILEH